jgi:hypothetical protein
VSQTGKLLIGNAGDEIFYDLAADPGETHPLSAPPFASELRAAMARVTSQLEAATAGRAVPVDAATQERLRALGYAH